MIWRYRISRKLQKPTLFETDAHAVGVSPNHATCSAGSSVVEGQLKACGYASRIGDAQTGAKVGQIVHQAVRRQGALTENDLGAFDDARPSDPPPFLPADFARLHRCSMPPSEGHFTKMHEETRRCGLMDC